MGILRRSPAVMVLCGLLILVGTVQIAESAPNATRTYREGVHQGASLEYHGGLPVLTVVGTPEEIGRQKAALTAKEVGQLAGYPKRLLEKIHMAGYWSRLVAMGESLVPQFPADHLREIKAFGQAADVDRELGIVANTMVDTYRGGFGCSSLIVAPERSETGGPLFGRNLDFFTLGVLDKYNLVTVHRPAGKHAFVAIGFPGMFGCLSGMNDAGLAVAVHEVFFASDGSSLFNPKGMPYALCFRRILETCSTVKEAEAMLRATPRTTMLNLAVCDRQGGGVLEMTPKTVAFRGSEEGICACTNHFRTRELALLRWCGRYRKLARSREMDTLGLRDVADKLHEVNQGQLTVQTMIFEPVALRLHLAVGKLPSSAMPMEVLDLKPLFHPQQVVSR